LATRCEQHAGASALATEGKQGFRGDPARRLTVDGVEMRTFGEQEVCGGARGETRFRWRFQTAAAPPERVSDSLTNE
jgi:hypothetical protein